jgi:hypothetical protein
MEYALEDESATSNFAVVWSKSENPVTEVAE